ncbi:hypothetical protein EBX31_14880 [bacterium]|jgi:hypothetical protein|nr:hypothetical protein [bacterium]
MRPDPDLPPAGVYDAEVYDLRDLGYVQTPFGSIRKVLVRFRVDSENRSYLVPRPYAFKFSSRSHLGRDLCSLLGRVPEPSFDLRDLQGISCQLHVGIEQLPDQRQRAMVLGILPSRKKALIKSETPFTAKQKERCHLPLGVDF